MLVPGGPRERGCARLRDGRRRAASRGSAFPGRRVRSRWARTFARSQATGRTWRAGTDDDPGAVSERAGPRRTAGRGRGAAEALAKEDIDEAIQSILYRENYTIKGVAFREHYDPKEYDPFSRKKEDPSFLKVTMPPFRDPLKKAQFDRDDGKRTLLQCETGKIYSMKEFKEVEEAMRLSRLPKLSRSRCSLTPCDWCKISACYIESELCQRSRLRVRKDINRSTCDLRHCPSDSSFPKSQEEETAFMSRNRGLSFLEEMRLRSQEGKKPSAREAVSGAHLPSGSLEQQDTVLVRQKHLPDI
ncbi:protein FAM228B-like [Sorex fumeus]|uniref:protein FAM228B-like n=1 Tax=Sorex fumeus TaxID=62283 RepID=UPI0024AD4FEA|nr:protein FAM228B-like [Sorex fumeus]